MKIRFSKAPTFTKAIIASAVFAIAYLASISNLPSCSDTVAIFNSGGECIERQSFLHTASGWLALICLVAAVLLLALKHRHRHRCQGGLRASASNAAPASSRETGSARDAESQWSP
jgi:choline-glycine betaine transporter